MASPVFRIPPFCYLHVVDQTTNVTRLELGPKTYIRQDNENVVLGPTKMIIVPPRHYCIIENPVVRNSKGDVVNDANGQAKLSHADLEVRLSQDPFPLWPGEVLKQPVTLLKVITANSGLHLKAIHDFKDNNGEKRTDGDEWIFEGPGTYIPRKEVEIVRTVSATIVKPNQAVKLRARKEFVDKEGHQRVTGEEWLLKKGGAYLPGAYEDVVDIVMAFVLTDKVSLHMRAVRTFEDDFGITRKNGEEWLIKLSDTEAHIPHVYEEVVGVVDITTLSNRQYCVILDPVDSKGVPQLGRKRVVHGEKSFFLMPGERLEKGIQNIYILGESEGLILKAIDGFNDGSVERNPGDRWMIRGPAEYVPRVEVEVLMLRKAIPLDANEGIYVRNVKTGKVRAVTGETYMLTHDEDLWEKVLSPGVEALLQDETSIEGTRDRAAKQSPLQRDKTKVITLRVAHNSAVQIYDYKEKKARIVFGPELVMLGPDEQFTQLSLSGGKPKQPNMIRSLFLMLGPDFCTDVIVVETADHARLQLQLSYNWHFEVDHKDDPVEAAKLFSVPDFVGDSCKAIASRVRGSVASVGFDEFHKNSARLIRASVFGLDENKKIRDSLKFPQNNLVFTSVDIQSVEPVDQKTRDSLQKSVQLAIEITTNSQEATARHEAERLEQEAKGRLERQKISDEAEAERSRKELLILQANSAAVESTGQAKAEAQSRAEALHIEGQAAVEQATLKAQALKISGESDLNQLKAAREAEIQYIQQQNELEVDRIQRLAIIETEKFKKTVEAIGPPTLLAIATAGPDLQVKLLQSLGLKSTLITDGNNPINLFSTANGLIGGKSFLAD